MYTGVWVVWGCHGVLLRLLVDTVADCSPPLGLVWPETPRGAVCRGDGLGEASGSCSVLYICASSWGFFWTKGSEVNNSFVSYSHGCSGVRGFRATEMVPGCRLGWFGTRIRFRQQMCKTRIRWLGKSTTLNDLGPNHPVFIREGRGVVCGPRDRINGGLPRTPCSL